MIIEIIGERACTASGTLAMGRVACGLHGPHRLFAGFDQRHDDAFGARVECLADGEGAVLGDARQHRNFGRHGADCRFDPLAIP